MNLQLQLGSTLSGERIVCNSLNNGHASITGQTGTGKSTLIKNLLAQLPEQEVLTIVFDCSGDYSSRDTDPHPRWAATSRILWDVCSDVYDVLSVRPIYTEDGYKEKTVVTANRLTQLLKKPLGLGNVQQAELTHVIATALEQDVDFSLKKLPAWLHACGYADSNLFLKVLNFCVIMPHGNNPILWNLNSSGMHVVDIHHLDASIQSLVIEIMLTDLWNFQIGRADKMPMVIVLDECQRLDFHQGSIIHRILLEGRKHEIAGWFSTQRLPFHGKMDNISEQAALQVAFRPGAKDLKKIAKNLASGNQKQESLLTDKLAKLKVGQFICQMDGRPLLGKADR